MDDEDKVVLGRPQTFPNSTITLPQNFVREYVKNILGLPNDASILEGHKEQH